MIASIEDCEWRVTGGRPKMLGFPTKCVGPATAGRPPTVRGQLSATRKGRRLKRKLQCADDVVADGVVDQFRKGVQVELEHDVGAMSFGGVDADAKNGGDFLVGLAFGEELQDFPLARSDAGAGGARGFEGLAGIERGSETGGEIGAVMADGIDGGEEDTIGVVLENVAASAGSDDLLNEVVGFVHGKDENLGIARSRTDAGGGVHAIEKRHADIEDGDIGLQLTGFVNGIAAIRGFGADLPPGARFEEGAESGANNGMIIRDKDAQGRHQRSPIV
jgi:hypothetical protein